MELLDSITNQNLWLQYQNNFRSLYNEKSGMLEELVGQEYVLMRYGASSHNAKKTKEWLHSRCDYLAFWPPNSPDLINRIYLQLFLIH